MATTMYLVKSWTLPKRRVGSWPAGHVSAAIDASTSREAAEHMARIIAKGHARNKARVIEVESYNGAKKTYTLSTDGVLNERAARRSHGARKRNYRSR